MEKSEFKANSLNGALLLAAEEFQTEPENIKYKIIPEKSRYFGHKNKEIFIEAWIDGEKKELNKLNHFLKELISKMNLNLSSRFSVKDEFVQIEFNGNDFKLLLYKNGELLNAIQYLLNRLFSKSVEKKIFCECNGFRRNKEKELSRLAHKHARNIEKNGKTIVLKDLTPFERRIIHLTINKYSGIESVSAGNNFLKTITIQKSP
jgi:spoIIIJ-associated protein